MLRKTQTDLDKQIIAASSEALYDIIMKSIYGKSFESVQDKYIKQIMAFGENEEKIKEEQKKSKNVPLGN